MAVEPRVEDLLSRMPLEDKAGLLFHMVAMPGDLDTPIPIVESPSTRSLLSERRLTSLAVLGTMPDGRQLAEWSNAVQRIAAEQPLGIPVTLASDPRHHFTDNPAASMLAGPFSQWPETLGLAAIGSEELVEAFADIARQEYLSVGLRLALHPQIDLATEPRWPRINGTFGEDAELTARLAAAYIRGFQGDALGPTSVATMTKHFPGGGPQKDGEDPHFASGREQVYPGGRFDHHLEPFKAAIAAGTSQIMPYYGMPVGTPYEEVGFAFNRSIVTTLLREELGFDGIVCTDFGLVTDRPHLGEFGMAKAWGVEELTPEDRLARLLDAGVDQVGGEYCSEMLVQLVKAGRVSEARIDESARRLLREKFVLGMFERCFVEPDAAATIVGRADFVAAGRQAQQDSLTLLTNGDVRGAPALPLRRGIRVYQEGFDLALLAEYATPVTEPADADVAMLRLQAPYDAGGEGFAAMFHNGSLEFPPEELARLQAICDAAPTVLDIYLDRPAVLTGLDDRATAIVANYGVAEGALLDVLFGGSSPKGRLPFDLPRSMATVVASDPDAPFSTEDPLFRFGHGLRY